MVVVANNLLSALRVNCEGVRGMGIEDVVNQFLAAGCEVGLGASALESFAVDGILEGDGHAVVVPDNLLRLMAHVRAGSVEHRVFLIRILRYFHGRPPFRVSNDSYDEGVVQRLLEAVERLERSNRLIVLGDDEVAPEIAEAFDALYPGHAFEISLSPRRNFLRDYLVRLYSWSRRTGGLVVEHGRRVFSDMGHHLATLQLPDKLDQVVGLKSRYINRMFAFRGGRAAKYFVGCALGVASMSYPAAGIVGLVIAFADP